MKLGLGLALTARRGGGLPNTATFGANTPAGEGGIDVGNATSITSGDPSGHWEITAGVLTPTATGAGNLSGTYSLDFDNGATLDVTIAADARHVAKVTEIGAIIDGTVTVGAGETVFIRAGNYDFRSYQFYNKCRNLPNPLLFRGEDGAVLTNWAFVGAVPAEIGNVTFEDVRFFLPSDPSNWDPANPVYGQEILNLVAGRNINFRRVRVHSDLGAAGDGDFPVEDIRGFVIDGDVENVVFEDSEIDHVFFSAQLGGTSVTFRRNDIHDTFADAIGLFPCDTLLVEANTLRDYVGDHSAIHPDHIQMQRNGSYRNVTIRGNVAWPGDFTRMRAGDDISVDTVVLSADTTLDVATHANRPLNMGSANLTHTLPLASSCKGETFFFNRAGHDFTIDAQPGDTDADYTFPHTHTSNLPAYFRSTGSGWARIQPGLRSKHVVFDYSRTLAIQHDNRRVLADTSGGPVTFTLPTSGLPAGAKIPIGLYDSDAHPVTVVVEGGAPMTRTETDDSSTSVEISQFFAQRLFQWDGTAWRHTGGGNSIQGIFGNPYDYENWQVYGNAMVVNTGWGMRMEGLEGGANITGTHLQYNNGYLPSLPPDSDGDGVFGPADGYSITPKIEHPATTYSNIVADVITQGSPVENNLTLGVHPTNGGNPAPYAAFFVPQTRAGYNPSTRDEVLEMFRFKPGVPEADYHIGPHAVWDFEANAPKTVAVPTVLETTPAQDGTVQTHEPITFSLDQVLTAATATLTNTTSGLTEAVSASVQGRVATITPNSLLSETDNYTVTLDSANTFYSTALAAPVSVDFATTQFTDIAFDSLSKQKSSGAGTSLTLTGYEAGAGRNRAVLIAVGTFGSGGNEAITGVTWGGVAAELVVESVASFEGLAFYRVREADFPSGANGDIVASFAGSCSNSIIQAFTLQNVTQGSLSNTVASGSVSAAITVSDPDSLVIGMGHASVQDSEMEWTTGLIKLGSAERYASDTTSTMLLGWAKVGTGSFTATHSQGSGRPDVLLVDFPPA